MKIETRSTKQLKEFEGNPKKHTKQQVGRIALSITKFGFTQPIVVDHENTILVGHGRWKAAKKLKLAEVPVVTLDSLTDAQRNALVVIDNAIASETGFDAEMLLRQFEALEGAEGLDLEGLGLVIEQDGDEERGEGLAGRNPVKEAYETYANAKAKQMVFYFLVEEFEIVKKQFDDIAKKLGVNTRNEVILKTLEAYERRAG